MGWGTTYSLLQISLCDVGDSKVWKTAHHLLCDVTSHDFLIIQKEIGLLCVINHKNTISLNLDTFHFNCLNYYS